MNKIFPIVVLNFLIFSWLMAVGLVGERFDSIVGIIAIPIFSWILITSLNEANKK